MYREVLASTIEGCIGQYYLQQLTVGSAAGDRPTCSSRTPSEFEPPLMTVLQQHVSDHRGLCGKSRNVFAKLGPRRRLQHAALSVRKGKSRRSPVLQHHNVV